MPSFAGTDLGSDYAADPVQLGPPGDPAWHGRLVRAESTLTAPGSPDLMGQIAALRRLADGELGIYLDPADYPWAGAMLLDSMPVGPLQIDPATGSASVRIRLTLLLTAPP